MLLSKEKKDWLRKAYKRPARNKQYQYIYYDQYTHSFYATDGYRIHCLKEPVLMKEDWPGYHLFDDRFHFKKTAVTGQPMFDHVLRTAQRVPNQYQKPREVFGKDVGIYEIDVLVSTDGKPFKKHPLMVGYYIGKTPVYYDLSFIKDAISIMHDPVIQISKPSNKNNHPAIIKDRRNKNVAAAIMGTAQRSLAKPRRINTFCGCAFCHPKEGVPQND